MSDQVTVEVAVEGGATGRGRRTLLRLHWRRDDPLAVELRVIAQPDHPALPRGRWTVLRDFLRYGIDTPTGDGDVRIRPDVSDGRVSLELVGSGRPCTVSVGAEVVRDFLDATERVVPAGEERSEMAIDALIERLMQA